MNRRTLLGRLLSPAGFGLVLLFLLLPFVTVSCGADAPLDATFTGFDMVTGAQPEITGDLGGSPVDAGLEQQLLTMFADNLDLQPLAFLGALAVLLAMASELISRRRTRHAVGAGLAALAAVLLVGAMLGVAGQVEEAMRVLVTDLGGSAPPSEIQPRYGFGLTLVSLAVLAAAHGVALWRAEPSHAPTADSPAADTPAELDAD